MLNLFGSLRVQTRHLAYITEFTTDIRYVEGETMDESSHKLEDCDLFSQRN